MCPATHPPTGVPDTDPAYERFLGALVAGDRQQCRDLFDGWLADGTELEVEVDVVPVTAPSPEPRAAKV